jgi:glycerophosphoryl diester phosphodiesterase
MLRIGHRGACGYEPENTLRSFAKALDLKVDMVHLDAQVCASGEAVVFRDESVGRTTGGHGYVEKMTFEQLSALDAGKGERIPTLPQVLELISARVPVNIELHGTSPAAAVFKAISHYVEEHGWKFEQFVISSLDYRHITEFKKICPQVGTVAISASIPTNYAEYATEAGVQGVNLWHECVQDDYVADIRRRNLKLYTWTVNEKEDIDRMMKHGVDGIFSDYPDRI